jgi:hypothetical protein
MKLVLKLADQFQRLFAGFLQSFDPFRYLLQGGFARR